MVDCRRSRVQMTSMLLEISVKTVKSASESLYVGHLNCKKKLERKSKSAEG